MPRRFFISFRLGVELYTLLNDLCRDISPASTAYWRVAAAMMQLGPRIAYQQGRSPVQRSQKPA